LRLIMRRRFERADGENALFHTDSPTFLTHGD
jgi:hypothetical protein